MAKEEAKKTEKACKCADKCECTKDEKCGCGCGCSCCCGCKGKLVKLIALIIVFLAGIGCGCLMCCCGGCKARHHIPAPMAKMAKYGMPQPKNNVIVIRTNGDEIVPEVAKVDGDFRNFKKHSRKHMRPAPVEAPAVPAPVAIEAPIEAPVAPTPVEAPAAPASAETPAAE